MNKIPTTLINLTSRSSANLFLRHTHGSQFASAMTQRNTKIHLNKVSLLHSSAPLGASFLYYRSLKRIQEESMASPYQHSPIEKAPVRISLLTPITHTTLETDLQRSFVPKASIHTHRFSNTNTLDELSLKASLDPLLTQFQTHKPDGIVLDIHNHNSSLDYQQESSLVAHLSEQLETPVFTPNNSLMQFINKMGFERIALLTPFKQSLHKKVVKQFAQEGLHVQWNNNIILGNNLTIDNIPSHEIINNVLISNELQTSGSEALFLLDSNLRALEVVPHLKTALPFPVYSTNLSLMSDLQHQLDIPFTFSTL